MDADIYIIGGETGSGVTSSVEIYHNTMFVSDESIIQVESENKSVNKSNVEIANMNTPKTEAEGVYRCWLKEKLLFTQFFVLNSHGYIYVIGGRSDVGKVTQSCERYCIEKNQWETLADMHYQRTQFRIASFNDRILVGRF